MCLAGIKEVMFNNRAKKDSEKVLEKLRIRSGDVIGDIGSGGGYYTILFSALTASNGKVYAVDVDKALLDRIEMKVKRQQLHNVETILVKENNCTLAKESCDLVFMRNVFHHISNPTLYFKNPKKSIKPGGRIAVIDWSSGNSMIKHNTSEKTIIKTLQEAGYRHVESFDFLKNQSFNIFHKTEE